MAEPVNRAANSLTTLGFVLGMFAAPALATVEGLPDPTRPPVSTDGTVPAASSGPALQSVLVSPGRTIAIISGKAVKVGDKFGDANVVKITESEVVLRSGKRIKTLKLFPGIEKRLTPSHAGAKPESLGQQR
jgi:MSHA biogenesis protein MshK